MADTRNRSTDAGAGSAGRASRSRSTDATGGASAREAPPAVCPVAFCPICTAVSAVNRASPDVVQHLLMAGQQFLLALKAVVDARAADIEGEPHAEETSMERIEIG